MQESLIESQSVRIGPSVNKSKQSNEEFHTALLIITNETDKINLKEKVSLKNHKLSHR
jgi:hypothetical protein